MCCFSLQQEQPFIVLLSWTVFPFFSVGDRCADLGKVSSHMVLLTVAHAVLFVFLNSSAVCVTFSPTASRVRIDRPITFS